MIIRRDTENVARCGHESEKRVERPGDAGVGGEDQNRAQQQQQHDDERDEPPFFLLPGELEKFFKE